jgi:hypothetical protein
MRHSVSRSAAISKDRSEGNDSLHPISQEFSMPMTASPPRDAPAQRLRTTMAAMRVSFTWFGVRKALSDEQKARAADAFGAEGEFLSAGKKLIGSCSTGRSPRPSRRTT